MVPACVNAAAWIWAAMAFRGDHVLLGIGGLAYCLGLRHALDADHIAAIDNVTRNFACDQQRSFAVGLYFSLGHSTVVVLACIGIAAAAKLFRDGFGTMLTFGGMVGTLVSALFLVLIAVANLKIIVAAPRAFHALGKGDRQAREFGRGAAAYARAFRPMFRLVRRSRQMYPVGVLFGLGFDTAASVAALGIAAAGAAHGFPVVSIVVFAALFAAGMTLVDTLDGILMTGACGWSATRPLTRFRYNLTVTALATAAALLVAGVELTGLARGQSGLETLFWRSIGFVSGHFAAFGAAITVLLSLGWVLFLPSRWRRNGEVPTPDG